MIFVRYKADVAWWVGYSVDKRFTVNKLNRVTKGNLYLLNYMIFDDGYFLDTKDVFNSNLDTVKLHSSMSDILLNGECVFELISKEEFCQGKSEEDIKALDLVIQLLESEDPSNMEIARIMYNKLNWNGKIKKINNSTI